MKIQNQSQKYCISCLCIFKEEGTGWFSRKLKAYFTSSPVLPCPVRPIWELWLLCSTSGSDVQNGGIEEQFLACMMICLERNSLHA
jgi:hypothetical protein